MEGVYIVDSSEAVAKDLDSFVVDSGSGTTELYFTDRYQNLDRMVELIMGERIPPVLVSEGSLPGSPF